MSYAPPSGSGLPFNLTGAYSPPTGNSVSVDFGTQPNVAYVNPQGFDASSFGTASCGNVAATVAPEGINSAQYGTAQVDNAARQIVTQWTLDNPFGAARVSNVQTISNAGGINQNAFGSIFNIVLGYYTPPVGTNVGFLFVGGYIPPAGAIPIDFANTYIYSYIAPPGFTGAVGTPTVYASSQTVAPTGFDSSAYGTPTFVGLPFDGYGNIPPGGFGTAYLSRRFSLEGFDSSVFGTTSISPQYVRPQGWTGAIGSPTFDQTLTTRTVSPPGFSSFAMGAVKVDPRFVYPFGFPSTGDSARFGNVQIQLGTLYPSSIPPGDFGIPRVDDGKQYVTPAGIAAPEFPQPQVIGRWEYIYPSSVIEAGIFGDLSVKRTQRVVAPEGWQDSQFPNFAPTVYNRNQVVLPFGWASPGPFYSNAIISNAAWVITPTTPIGPETFGPETDVGGLIKYVSPQGFDSAQFGSTTVVNDAQVVDLNGYGITGAFGNALVAAGARVVEPSGSYFGGFGDEHVVEYKTKYLSGVGGIFAFQPSTGTVVESSIRTIDHGTYGEDMSSLGATTVWFRVRTVAPPAIAYQFPWQQFGGNTRVEYAVKYLPLTGWQSGAFGTTTVARNEVFVRPPSIVGAVGQPTVQWSRRFLPIRTIGDISEYGTPQVDYNPRYIYQTVGENDALYRGAVGVPWNVENRNKTIGAYGWRSSRFSAGNYVYNNARVLEAKGSDTSVFGTAFVADAVRTITTIGHQSSKVSYWGVVYNYTRIIEPTGIPRPFPGIPYVFSNTQYIDFTNAGSVFTQWGDQFVAYAIRTVSLDQQPGSLRRDGIPPPPFPTTHYVGLFRQLVAPNGIDAGRIGDPVFEEKFSIVKPWGNRFDVFGEASVRNVTPEVAPLAWIEFEMSPRHYVGLYTRYVGLADRGIPPPHEFLPRPHVEFRTKTIQVVPGIDSLRIPLLHDVRFDAPVIPGVQRIQVSSVPEQGNPSDAAGYGRPTVLGQPQPEGWVSSRFGSASVRLQGCTPLWDWPSSEFGTPTLNPARFLRVVPGILSEAHGKPRLSPHTVYCTDEAPQQYRDNHGPKQWLVIDGDAQALGRLQLPPEDVQWGTAAVLLKTNRVVAHVHGLGTEGSPDFTIGEKFGTQEVSNKIRRVYPEGIPPDLMGIPDIPFHQEVFSYPFDAARYGEATVALGPPPATTQTVAPPSLVATQFGTTSVELFNRTIFPVGTRMDVFGDNNPMVHFPRTVQNAGALDASAWGDARVEYKDRVIYPQGHDSFTMDYDILYFNDRLRIFKKTHPVYPTGQNQAAFGTTDVKLKVQVIAPYQIAAPSCLGHDVYVLEEV